MIERGLSFDGAEELIEIVVVAEEYDFQAERKRPWQMEMMVGVVVLPLSAVI